MPRAAGIWLPSLVESEALPWKPIGANSFFGSAFGLVWPLILINRLPAMTVTGAAAAPVTNATAAATEAQPASTATQRIRARFMSPPPVAVPLTTPIHRT